MESETMFDELTEALIARCPDYAGIQVVHLGRLRTKITAVAADLHVVHLIVSLSEEEPPEKWAESISKRLNAPLET